MNEMAYGSLAPTAFVSSMPSIPSQRVICLTAIVHAQHVYEELTARHRTKH
jgi:hypothetical protein